MSTIYSVCNNVVVPKIINNGSPIELNTIDVGSFVHGTGKTNNFGLAKYVNIDANKDIILVSRKSDGTIANEKPLSDGTTWTLNFRNFWPYPDAVTAGWAVAAYQSAIYKIVEKKQKIIGIIYVVKRKNTHSGTPSIPANGWNISIQDLTTKLPHTGVIIYYNDTKQSSNDFPISGWNKYSDQTDAIISLSPSPVNHASYRGGTVTVTNTQNNELDGTYELQIPHPSGYSTMNMIYFNNVKGGWLYQKKSDNKWYLQKNNGSIIYTYSVASTLLLYAPPLGNKTTVKDGWSKIKPASTEITSVTIDGSFIQTQPFTKKAP